MGLAIVVVAATATAQESGGPAAWWKFDEGHGD